MKAVADSAQTGARLAGTPEQFIEQLRSMEGLA